jgi:hypothetical protein
MKLFIVISIFIFDVLCQKIKCPNPDNDTCIVVNNIDNIRKSIRCRGTGCPSCWLYRNEIWECSSKIYNECRDRNAIDIENLNYECNRGENPYIDNIEDILKNMDQSQ